MNVTFLLIIIYELKIYDLKILEFFKIWNILKIIKMWKEVIY